MKTSCLLFAMIGWVMLMSGASYAAPSSQPSSDNSGKAVSDPSTHDGNHQADGKPGDEKQNGTNTSTKGDQSNQGNVTKAVPQQAPNSQKGSDKTPENSNHANNPATKDATLPQPNSNQSTNAPKVGAPENKMDNNHGLPIRPAGAIAPTGPVLKDERHLGPNPPIIGGPAKTHSANTAVINGTGMNRKHG